MKVAKGARVDDTYVVALLSASRTVVCVYSVWDSIGLSLMCMVDVSPGGVGEKEERVDGGNESALMDSTSNRITRT